jgi:hypothetical protein
MRGLLYEQASPAAFIFISLILGGAAAFATGRAIALTWRPIWHLVPYAAMVTFAVRFLHWSLFNGAIFSVQYFILTWALLGMVALIGFMRFRADQMRIKYGFLQPFKDA